MLAIAVRPPDVDRLRARLAAEHVARITLTSPSATRVVMVVLLENEDNCASLAAALRREGEMAVARPRGGGALAAWRRDTEPVAIGEALTVRLAWSEHEIDADRPVVEIAPGGFGNGRHPTTRLLLEELAARISGGERVLDVGCGSGVLGAAALRLGAAEVIATDVKPEALASAAQTAQLNGLASRMHPMAAPLPPESGTFDVVLANIARAGVVELAPELVRRTARDGWLGISGITDAQRELVADYLRPLVEVQHCSHTGWAMSVFARR